MTNGTPASSQIINLERMVAERDAEIERIGRELDIVHETLTELYNIDLAVPVIKGALARIAAVETPNIS